MRRFIVLINTIAFWSRGVLVRVFIQFEQSSVCLRQAKAGRVV